MKIRIGKSQYFLDGDRMQYLLSKECSVKNKITKEMSIIIKELYTYQTIEDLVEDLVGVNVKIAEAKDIIEAGKKVQEIHAMIDEVVKTKHWKMDKDEHVRIKHTPYYISKDNWSYSLSQEVKAKDRKTGEATTEIRDLFSYASVAQLLHRLTEERVRTSKATTIDELNMDIEKTHKIIDEITRSRHWTLYTKAKK